jgi:hypothetical protein
MELRQCFGSIDYWTRRFAGSRVDDDALFDKRRKEVHRYTIADVNGPLTLTVPIVKPHGLQNAGWKDVRLSDHGQWWHVHRISLESAYGRTPFFEFYIDRFLPFLSKDAVDRFPSIIAYNQAIDREISSILLFYKEKINVADQTTTVNLAERPYWQPRQDKFGFLPNLSILDLIFCLGPEAALFFER